VIAQSGSNSPSRSTAKSDLPQSKQGIVDAAKGILGLLGGAVMFLGLVAKLAASVQHSHWASQSAPLDGRAIAESKIPLPHYRMVEAIADLRTRAVGGDVVAARDLGKTYLTGKGVPADYSEALNWFTSAANKGDAVAENNLGVMFSSGLGVPKDDTKAFSWFQKSADQDNAIGEFNVSAMYFKGTGVGQDYAQAFTWCQKSANQNDPDAEYALGVMYESGQGVSQDSAIAADWYRKAALLGQTDAETALKRIAGN
jgi:TPR repeat protein